MPTYLEFQRFRSTNVLYVCEKAAKTLNLPEQTVSAHVCSELQLTNVSEPYIQKQRDTNPIK